MRELAGTQGNIAEGWIFFFFFLNKDIFHYPLNHGMKTNRKVGLKKSRLNCNLYT